MRRDVANWRCDVANEVEQLKRCGMATEVVMETAIVMATALVKRRCS